MGTSTYRDPSPTEIDYYWKKSTLSRIGTSIKYILADEMVKNKEDEENLSDKSNFLQCVIDEAKEKQLDSYHGTTLNYLIDKYMWFLCII